MIEKNLLETEEQEEIKLKAGPGEEFDFEGYMVRTQLRRMKAQAEELISLIKVDEQFPAWMQAKVTLASEYMDGVYDFYKYSDYSITADREDDNDEDDDNESLEEEVMYVTFPTDS